MSCDKTIEELSAWLDGELSAEEEAAVRAHLEECANCRELLEDLRETAAAVKELPPVRAPKDFQDRVMSAVTRESERRRVSWARVLWPVAATLLVASVLYLLNQSHRPGIGGPRTVVAMRHETAAPSATTPGYASDSYMRAGPESAAPAEEEGRDLGVFSGERVPAAATDALRKDADRPAAEGPYYWYAERSAAEGGEKAASEKPAELEGAFARSQPAAEEAGSVGGLPASAMAAAKAEAAAPAMPATPMPEKAGEVVSAPAMAAAPQPQTEHYYSTATAKTPVPADEKAKEETLPVVDIVVLTNNEELAYQRVNELAAFNRWPIQVSADKGAGEVTTFEWKASEPREGAGAQLRLREKLGWPAAREAGQPATMKKITLDVNNLEIVEIGNALADAGLLGPAAPKSEVKKGMLADNSVLIASNVFVVNDGAQLQAMLNQEMNQSQRQMAQLAASNRASFYFRPIVAGESVIDAVNAVKEVESSHVPAKE